MTMLVIFLSQWPLHNLSREKVSYTKESKDKMPPQQSEKRLEGQWGTGTLYCPGAGRPLLANCLRGPLCLNGDSY